MLDPHLIGPLGPSLSFMGLAMLYLMHRQSVVLALSASLCACGDDPTEPQLIARNVSAQCSLSFSAPPTVPPPAVFTQTDAGSCSSATLGALSYAGELEINTTALTQRGTRTFTASDGSSFRASSEGTSVPRGQGLVDFTASLRVLSGTGRYSGISGTLQGQGTANQATRTTTVTFTGTLTYRADAAGGG